MRYEPWDTATVAGLGSFMPSLAFEGFAAAIGVFILTTLVTLFIVVGFDLQRRRLDGS